MATRFSTAKSRSSGPATGTRSGSVEKYADDVVFLPPPDLGNGPVVGAGSFGYGTSTGCSDKQREGVNKFLEFSLTTENLVKISDTQLVIPATAEAAAESKNYGPMGTSPPSRSLSRSTR